MILIDESSGARLEVASSVRPPMLLIPIHGPEESPGDGFVRNGGGVSEAVAMTAGEYAALTPKDPNTLYVIFP